MTESNVSPLRQLPKKRKRKKYQHVLPDTLSPALLSTLEQLGMARQDPRSIAAYLGCSEQEVVERMEKDAVFSSAILRGRVTLLQNAAVVVAASIQGQPLPGINGAPGASPTDMQVKAAMFYLEKHGPNWLRE